MVLGLVRTLSRVIDGLYRTIHRHGTGEEGWQLDPHRFELPVGISAHQRAPRRKHRPWIPAGAVILVIYQRQSIRSLPNSESGLGFVLYERLPIR